MGKEKSITFKADPIERAGVVVGEAISFYNTEFEKDIKEIDPAYDPKALEYKNSSHPSLEDTVRINKTIEDGGVIDSAKDLSPMAKRDSNNLVQFAQGIKTGSPSQVIEKIGIDKIKEMPAFKEVSEKYNSQMKDESLYLQKVLSGFSDIIEAFNNPEPHQGSLLYTKQNNDIISALSKILKQEGLKNEEINISAGNFDKNFTGISIEGNKEKSPEVSKTPEVEGKSLITELDKTKPQGEIKTHAGELDKAKVEEDKRVESPLAESNKVESSNTSAIKIEDKGLLKTNTEEKNKGTQAGADFLMEALGLSDESLSTIEGNKQVINGSKIIGSIEKTGVLETKTELGKNEGNKTGSDFLKGIYGNKIEGATGEKIPVELKSSIITPKNETKTGAVSIKETILQKLSSVTPQPNIDEKTKAEEIILKNDEGSKSVTEVQTKEAKSENVIKNTDTKEKASAASTSDTQSSDLGGKMDLVASLLVQLNETLQGPLLITNVNKIFES